MAAGCGMGAQLSQGASQLGSRERGRADVWLLLTALMALTCSHRASWYHRISIFQQKVARKTILLENCWPAPLAADHSAIQLSVALRSKLINKETSPPQTGSLALSLLHYNTSSAHPCPPSHHSRCADLYTLFPSIKSFPGKSAKHIERFLAQSLVPMSDEICCLPHTFSCSPAAFLPCRIRGVGVHPPCPVAMRTVPAFGKEQPQRLQHIFPA